MSLFSSLYTEDFSLEESAFIYSKIVLSDPFYVDKDTF